MEICMRTLLRRTSKQNQRKREEEAEVTKEAEAAAEEVVEKKVKADLDEFINAESLVAGLGHSSQNGAPKVQTSGTTTGTVTSTTTHSLTTRMSNIFKTVGARLGGKVGAVRTDQGIHIGRSHFRCCMSMRHGSSAPITSCP